MPELDRLRNLRMLILDVDGIFTDGRTWQNVQGEFRRVFCVRDTMGIKALRKAGCLIGVVTSARAEEINAHMKLIGVDAFIDDCDDKWTAIQQMLSRFGLSAEDAGYMTEDVSDLDAISHMGVSMTVPTAHQTVRSACQIVVSKMGGDGAILEVCNLVLQHGSFTRVTRARRSAAL